MASLKFSHERLASWEDCLAASFSLKITPDRAKAKSLLEIAKARVKFLQKNKLQEENANFLFEAYYSSVVELLHGIIIIEGFKVNNHLCLGFFLREILKDGPLFRLFDDCRWKRNSLIYYGKMMDFETAQESIEKIRKLLKQLEGMLSVSLKKGYYSAF